MFKGYAPILVLWLGGLGVAAVLASTKGQVDHKAERGRQIGQVTQLTTTLRLAFDNFAERSASDLARIIEVEMTQEQMGSWLSESPFQAVALVDQDVNGSWKVDWARSKVANSGAESFQSWLNKLPLEKINGEFVSWNRVDIHGQRPSMILGVQLRLKTATTVKTQIALGQLAIDHLSVLTDPLKAEGSEIFLIDSAGYSLTFPNPQYVGSYMDVHPLVNVAVKSQTISDVVDSRNLTGDPTIGGYERVKNSNVYVIANLPASQPIVYVTRQLSESALVIFGILIFLSLPLVMISRSQVERINQLRQTLASVGSSATASVEVKTTPSPDMVNVAKQELFERFANVVFHQLKGPIYAAIGKTSRLLGSDSTGNSRDVVVGLETELRKAKVFVESLGRTLKASEKSGTEVNLTKVFEADLARNAEALQKKNIDVEFVPGTSFIVKSHPDDIRKIFLTILNRTWDIAGPQTQSARRKLIIRIEHQGPIIRTSFLFHGTKIGETKVERFFDISTPDDLDLSVARGLAHSWNGQLTAEDSLAGLRLVLELPVAPGFEVVKAKTAPPPTAEAKVEAKIESKPAAQEPSAESLVLKKVDEALNKVLPPPPKPYLTGISVVEDLTLTKSKTESETETGSEVKIRKPRVRLD